MEIDFLRHFGLEKPVVDILRGRYGEQLLPVQESAIVTHNIFDGANMLISAPTSSGKTLVGEVAALGHILKDRAALYLVPTKALAFEKYETLTETYSDLDFKVVLSSRDHREFDTDIAEGKYQMAVVVYEKLLNLLMLNPGLLNYVGLVIIDELQTLFDVQRGARIEELITCLKRTGGLQIVALSAVLEGRDIADWLDAALVQEKERPVELRQGAFCRGKFHYREYNSGEEGEEEFFETTCSDEKQALLEAASYFAMQNEQTLIFVPARHMTFSCASMLFEMVDLPPAEKALAALEQLDENKAGERLRMLLSKSIAVHSSDLTWSQREVVEKGLASGEVKLVVATSTLSEGLNMPVVNTLVCRDSYQTSIDSFLRGQPPQLGRLSKEQFHNMTGRSGRMGRNSFGRGMVAVGHEGEVRGVFARYLGRGWNRHEPVLEQSSFETMALELLASKVVASERDLQDFLGETFSARESGIQWVQQKVQSALQTLERSRFIKTTGGRCTITGIGSVLAQNSLDAETGEWFLDWLNNEPDYGYSSMALICILALCPESNRSYFPFFNREWKERLYERKLWQALDSESGEGKTFFHRMFGEDIPQTFETGRGMKKSLFLKHWCSKTSTEEIENMFKILEGLAQKVGEEISWLARGFCELAKIISAHPDTIAEAETLAQCARLGLPEQWKKFGTLNVAGLTREMVKRLCSEGYEDLKCLKDLDETTLSNIIPSPIAKRVKRYLEQVSTCGRGAPAG